MAEFCGLTKAELDHILEAVDRFDEIVEVVVFGSRAKGNYKPGSDVDLAVKGDRITDRTLAQFADYLNEETPLPYFFDVVHYNCLDQRAIVDHIDRVGVVIYNSPIP